MQGHYLQTFPRRMTGAVQGNQIRSDQRRVRVKPIARRGFDSRHGGTVSQDYPILATGCAFDSIRACFCRGPQVVLKPGAPGANNLLRHGGRCGKSPAGYGVFGCR